jgi:hypothetical protein
MKKNQSIGPVHILLDDRYAKQLKPFRDAIIRASKRGKPRGVFGQVAFIPDGDGGDIPCLTIMCPTHATGKRYVEIASRILGVKRSRVAKESNAQGQPAATEPAQQAGRGPLGCADVLGADVLPEGKP